MTKAVTLAVLAEKMDNMQCTISELKEAMKEQRAEYDRKLDCLSEDTKKNSLFREKAIGIVGIVTTVAVMVGGFLFSVIEKWIFRGA